MLLLAATALTLLFPSAEPALDAFADPQTAIVLMEPGEDGAVVRRNSELCDTPLPPCSTFKIWNTAIGLETRKIKDVDGPFYVWDGQKRWLDAWNRDVSVREAFKVSSVPAYQELARKIGPEAMDAWIRKLNYGDHNTSSGIDVFWLPGKGRQPLLISANRQAELMLTLLQGPTPLSEKTIATLADVMEVKKTDKGTLYGKTGTAIGEEGGAPAVGWFVGRVECKAGPFVFAAVTRQPAAKKGEKAKLLGPEMRDRVIRLLEERGAL